MNDSAAQDATCCKGSNAGLQMNACAGIPADCNTTQVVWEAVLPKLGLMGSGRCSGFESADGLADQRMLVDDSEGALTVF